VNLSEATLYRWKQPYGALELSKVHELQAQATARAFRDECNTERQQGNTVYQVPDGYCARLLG
jgi:hypothetical protein